MTEWSSIPGLDVTGRLRSLVPACSSVRARSSAALAEIVLFVVSPLKLFVVGAWKMDERQPPTTSLPRCWQPDGMDVNVCLRSIFFSLSNPPPVHLMYWYTSEDHFAVRLTQMFQQWGNYLKVTAAELNGCRSALEAGSRVCCIRVCQVEIRYCCFSKKLSLTSWSKKKLKIKKWDELNSWRT